MGGFCVSMTAHSRLQTQVIASLAALRHFQSLNTNKQGCSCTRSVVEACSRGGQRAEASAAVKVKKEKKTWPLTEGRSRGVYTEINGSLNAVGFVLTQWRSWKVWTPPPPPPYVQTPTAPPSSPFNLSVVTPEQITDLTC